MNSSELKGFLTGLMLGDGYIDSGVTKRSFRIKSINKDFIEMIYHELSSCTNFKMKISHFDECYRDGAHHKEYWELSITAHPYFAKIYHHFYDDNRHRKITKIALWRWLTPRGIANWYMSDGYVCHVGKTKGYVYNRRIEFCTDRYSKKDVQRIQSMLMNKYSISTSLIKRSGRYRLRVLVSSYPVFIKLIRPYIVNSMQYKLYLAYIDQPTWMDEEMWQHQEWLRSAMVLPSKVEEQDIV